MKTHINNLKALLIFALLLSTKLYAQNDSLRLELDRIFEHVDKSQISTGFLKEYGYQFLPIDKYNGVLSTDNTVDNKMLRMIYTTVISGNVTNTFSLATFNQIDQNATTALQSNNANPVNILLLNYASLKPNAHTSNLFSLVNNQLYDVAGRSQSPYNTNTVFAAAPNFKTCNDGKLKLIFNNQMFYTNTGLSITSIEVNFDDGNGFVAATLGSVLQCNYTSDGNKKLTFKLTASNGNIYQCYSNVAVSGSSSGAARYAVQNNPTLVIPANANHSGGDIFIQYSTSNPTRSSATPQFRRPFIVVEGYDMSDAAPLLAPPYTYNDFRTEIRGVTLNNGSRFDENLDDLAGYDLIFLNYHDGTDDILRNARLLQDLIELVNSNKMSGAEQNVVMGISMGGLVSRYCLAQMTKAGHPVTNFQNPQTRLLITHDSPHRGANIPLSIQHTIAGLNDFIVRVGPVSFSLNSVVGELQQFEVLRTRPATQQQLLAIVTNSSGNIQTNVFLDGVYRNMITFAPTDVQPAYQFVATSQGSQCGIPLFQPATSLVNLTASGDVSFLFGMFGTGYQAELELNALPNLGETKRITHLELTKTSSFLWFSWSKTLLRINQNSPNNMIPWDGVAGGTRPLSQGGAALSNPNPVQDYINILGLFSFAYYLSPVQPQAAFAFVPTTSSLDIDNIANINQPYIFPLNGLKGSRANKYIAQDRVFLPTGVLSSNITHTDFTARTSEWIFNQMQNTPNNILDCEDANACYDNNSFPITGNPVICTSSSSAFQLANLSSLTNQSVVWSISNNTLGSLSCSTCQSPTITHNQNGTFILTASINNPCSTTPFVITKTISTTSTPSAPLILSQLVTQPPQPNKWSFVAPVYYNNVNYFWTVNGLHYTTTNNFYETLVPCKTQVTVTCKVGNSCGVSPVSNTIITPIGYCPPKKGTRFNALVDILQHDLLKVNTATTNNWLAQLFFDEATIANEMIQRVHIYNKRGELMIENNELNTKNATIDITALPQDSYIIEVEGLNGYKELQTFHRSLLNQEHYQIEDIATGNIPMNVDFAEERLYVMQQKLFVELQSEPDIMNASPTLQDFASINANSSLGIIYQIEFLLGNNNVDEATTLLNEWQTTNDIDNNFKNYYTLYLRVIQGGTLNTEEIATLYNIAQSCPLVAGEIVYAARSLHNNLINDNDDYANACGYIAAKYTTNPIKLNQYLNIETSISPNPTKGIITIKLPTKDTGFKTIKITNAYGKVIAERKTFDRVIMMDLKAPTGIYFVNITNAVTGKTETQKLIIQ